tara:strand:+ start:233 stop:496 length:264 start_codon:yes stop_codon:yes gene_type:complete
MFLREIFEATSRVWGRIGNKQVRKYRCTHGQRKGRVMSSPAACMAPINISKSNRLKQTKAGKAKTIGFKGARTRRINPASQRLRRFN